jgi:hypothetical protein
MNKIDDPRRDQKRTAQTSSQASGSSSNGQQISGLASTLTSDVQNALDHQLGRGARVLSSVAQSMGTAADELKNDSPQIAALVRSVADRVDAYSRDLKGQTVTDLYQQAADLTRRNPALIFGIAALTGFLALRTIKSSGANANQSESGRYPSRSGDFYDQ